MGLPSQAHLCLLPVLLVFSAVCIAGTLSSVDMQASGTFSSGPPTGCGQASSSSAACSFSAYNWDRYGGGNVDGSASASSAFGSLSGAAYADAVQNNFGANFVSVLADFSWSASAWVAIGEVIWPSFTVVVGTSGQSWTQPYGSCIAPNCTASGTLAVSVPFTFGGLTNVGGSTSVFLNTEEASFSLSSIFDSSASLTLTGFSVYDASGNLVPGAVVTPLLSPEPGSVSLSLCGALVLWMLVAGFKLTRSTAPSRHPRVAPPR